MDALDRLGGLTALEKAVKEAKAEARSEADRLLLDAHEKVGVDRVALRLGGVEIGKITVTTSKGHYEIDDADAFEDFALCNGLAHEGYEIKPDHMRAAISLLMEEMPDAVESYTEVDGWDRYVEQRGGVTFLAGTDHIVPGVRWVEGEVCGTRVTGCDPRDVIPLLSASDSLPLLLGGE